MKSHSPVTLCIMVVVKEHIYGKADLIAFP